VVSDALSEPVDDNLRFRRQVTTLTTLMSTGPPVNTPPPRAAGCSRTGDEKIWSSRLADMAYTWSTGSRRRVSVAEHSSLGLTIYLIVL
jgi:hypothetical protein